LEGVDSACLSGAADRQVDLPPQGEVLLTAGLNRRISEIADARALWRPRIYALLRRAGWLVNAKRI
jgi:hypothetical protein